MKEILLTKGMVAFVDDEDFELLNQHKWCACKGGNTHYANRKVNGKCVSMQIILIGRKSGKSIDHKDGNGLNNQKSNLRYATKTENAQNQRRRAGSKSVYKGVAWHTRSGKWSVRIQIPNGKRISLGYFCDEKTAAIAYNKAALKYFGEYSRLNIFSSEVQS